MNKETFKKQVLKEFEKKLDHFLSGKHIGEITESKTDDFLGKVKFKYKNPTQDNVIDTGSIVMNFYN